MGVWDHSGLADPAVEGAYTVVAVIERAVVGRSEDAVREAILRWFGSSLAMRLPDAAWTRGQYRADSATGQFLTARRAEGETELWAGWFKRRSDRGPWASILTEAIVRVSGAEVKRAGFRLLAEISDGDGIGIRDSRLLGDPIEALCGLHASVLGGSAGATVARAEDQTRALANRLLSPDRKRPIIVISTRMGHERPSAINLSSNLIVKSTEGLADVYVLTARQTYILKNRVGRSLSVFNGAARIYMPGLERDGNPRPHRLIRVGLDANRPAKEKARLIFQGLAARASVGLYRFADGELPYAWLQDVEWSAGPELQPDFKAAPAALSEDTVARGGAEPGVPSDRFRPDGGRGSPETRSHIPRTRWRRFGAKLFGWLTFGRTERRALRERLERVRRNLKESEETRSRLEKELGQKAEWATLVEEENDEFKSARDQLQKKVDRLEAEVKELRPLPASWSDVASWCNRALEGKLMLLPAVERELHRAAHQKYEKVEEAARGLRWLAEDYRDSRLNGRGTDLRGRIPDLEATRNEPCGKDRYKLQWEGRDQLVDWHLKRGTSIDPRYCLRIYYFWDSGLAQVVVTHMPTHRSSPGRSL